MAEYYINSAVSADWAASTIYSSGDRVVPTRGYGTATAKKYVFECTTGGTSGGSEPTWGTTPGGTTSDNTAVWTCREATSEANASRYLDYIYNNRATAGDTIYINPTHSESPSGAYALTNTASTAANPIRVVCADFGAEPPTSLATGAAITAGTSFTFNDPIVAYGIEFNTTGTSNAMRINAGAAEARGPFINCTFNVNADARFDIWGNKSHHEWALAVLKNCTVNFASTSSQSFFYIEQAEFVMEGGAISSGGATNGVFAANSYDYGIAKLTCRGVDLSGISPTQVVGTGKAIEADFFDCKMKSSFTAARPTQPYHPKKRFHNCDSGNTFYRIKEVHYCGDIDSETTLVRTGGYTENGQGLSHKMTTTANASLVNPLVGAELAINNTTTGSAVTVTCEILHDSATNLTDKEVWLEVIGLDTTSYCKGSWYNDANAAYLLPSATAADQTASSETWTTTGMSNPNKQKLSVTFTPRQKGPIVARVVLAKASKTIYVCPELAVA